MKLKFEISFTPGCGELFSELGIANQLPLQPDQLLANLRGIQGSRR